MALKLYLAMTGAEILENGQVPSEFGIMSRSDALEEIPSWCPGGGMLVLTDEVPIQAKDMEQIRNLRRIVEQRQFESVLLDFQRPEDTNAKAFVRAALRELACPVCVSACYGSGLNCAVLLPPVPPDVPMEEYLFPWQGQEVWLEAALDGMIITVTPKGAELATVLRGERGKGEHHDEKLCCHYRVEVTENAVFYLRRSEDDLRPLLQKANRLGVTRAVGLYQELGHMEINE